MCRSFCLSKHSDGSVAETTSASKVVMKCQLLDWCEVGYVVVGEGEFCWAEPMYKISRVPLGPGAAAVIVNAVTKNDAYVWRPTTSIFSLGQALDSKISWPAEKIILDNDHGSTKNSNYCFIGKHLLSLIWYELVLCFNYGVTHYSCLRHHRIKYASMTGLAMM